MPYDETKEPRHPSWVTVSFSRISGERTFFGSSVKSSSWIRMGVSEAERYNAFGQDRIQGGLKRNLIEVDLSPAQFAELLTTMNVGTGVPGTMILFDGKRVEKYQEIATEVSKVQKYFKESMNEAAEEYREAKEKLAEILEKKTISKTDRQAILGLLESMIGQFTSFAPFAMEQFNESAGKIVTQAKAEVDAFITKAVVDTGLEQLRAQAPQLIGARED